MNNFVRKGVNQANFHSKTQGIFLMIEILVLSAILGMTFHSWIVFGLVFFIVAFLLFLPVVGSLIIFGVSAGIGISAGYSLYIEYHNLGMAAVVGLFIFLILFGLQKNDLDYLKDLGNM